VGDVGVGQPARQQAQDLALPLGQVDRGRRGFGPRFPYIPFYVKWLGRRFDRDKNGFPFRRTGVFPCRKVRNSGAGS
jgi:hypothetical protein